MALVMLPCDMPWWDSVKNILNNILNTKNTLELIDGMQKIYELCNVSLDPDEDTTNPEQFISLLSFLDNDLTTEERNSFLNRTLPVMVNLTLRLKELKPKGGLHFSLQQQPDCVELDYSLIASLIGNAFFSTFPKRTHKSHPTLQNFNFSNFFKHISSSAQKAKLKSIFHYFDLLNNKDLLDGSLKLMRQVMSGKEWLTIEDWLECSLPLCPVQIKHEGKLERAEANTLQICFTSSKLGGSVLTDGITQECINFMTFPDMLPVLLNVEALEDNEVFTVERARHISRIADPKHRANFEKIDSPRQMTVCCMDADDYTKLPIGQYEEDNILRELNKCLLGFQQKQSRTTELLENKHQQSNPYRHRRLSPIGESTGSAKSDNSGLNIPMITQQSCSTTRSGSSSSTHENNNLSGNKLKVQLETERKLQKHSGESLVHNRRGRFIVLGSSGECLPVSRRPLEPARSLYDSCSSSDEEFLSARTSLEDASEDENYNQRYSEELEAAERRKSFAQRLKEAMDREKENEGTSCSTDSSYAVGISVGGDGVRDKNIKIKRQGSTGFALREDTMDEEFLNDSLQQEKKWIDKFKNKHVPMSKKDSSKSSDYSFSTEYSSELEEVYEQFSRWLEHPILETDKGTKKELDGRELAVVKFAGSLLKRTLSESFADFSSSKNNKLVLNAKSLSLELARQKHKLAAQLASDPLFEEKALANTSEALDDRSKFKKAKKRRAWFVSCIESIVQTLEDVTYSFSLPKQLSQIAQTTDGIKPISTGNWGCGSSRKGDVQLKVVIQWLAASVAGAPTLIYYTCGHQQLAKLDTVCRILVDRKWCVKDLAQAILRYSNHVLHGREISGNLFHDLIGVERTV